MNRTCIPLFLLLCTCIMAADKKKPKPPYKLPVLSDNMEERLARIAGVTYKGPKNDTRCGDGFVGTELFELHRELRRLVHESLNKAPTKRELEILKLLLHGKPDRAIDSRGVLNKIRQRTEKGELDNLFYDGYDVHRLMENYRATGDR